MGRNQWYLDIILVLNIHCHVSNGSTIPTCKVTVQDDEAYESTNEQHLHSWK